MSSKTRSRQSLRRINARECCFQELCAARPGYANQPADVESEFFRDVGDAVGRVHVAD